MTRKLGSSPTGPAVLMSKFVQGLQIYMLPQYVAPNPQANLSAYHAGQQGHKRPRILADAVGSPGLVITDSAVPHQFPRTLRS